MTQKPVIGLLNPGAMGHRIGACAVQTGHKVLWASAGRSPGTRARAEQAGLEDAGNVADLVRASDIVISVCPPHAAEDMAREVAAAGFAGIYLEANAVSPETTRQIEAIVAKSGATSVDGGIIGSPPKKAGTTWLYVSGKAAARIAPLFEGSPLEVIEVGPAVGSASALKMCYAGYTKGTSALLLAILSVAEAEGVDQPLRDRWAATHPFITDHLLNTVQRSLPKAWRFAGEMEEIAATFESHGTPGGFHQAAAEVYRRLSGFKESDDNTPMEAAFPSIRNDRRDAAE